MKLFNVHYSLIYCSANSGNWGTSGGPGASQSQWNANSATGTQRPPTSQPDGNSSSHF